MAKGAGRDESIDALKFYAMGLVVMMHEFNLVPAFKRLPHASTVVDVLWAFSMPLFALLSGLVLWGREGHHPVRFLWRKAQALVVPYIVWISLELPIRQFVFHMKGYEPSDWLPRLAWALIDVSRGIQMWFLIALFWVFVVFVLLRLVSTSRWWLAATAVALSQVPRFWPDAPWTVSKVCWLYLFLVIGYLIASERERLSPFAWPAMIAGFIAFPVFVAFDASVPKELTALAGIGASWAVYRVLPKRSVAIQAHWGRLSLGIYGAQMLVLPFLVFGDGYLGVALSWSATMAACVVISLLLERWAPTRAVLLGQWPRPKPRAEAAATA
ncbi:MAG TPA: acyltransferase [Coriobacteriia bacterium]|nr:acyltransferase [Coriobacteriia bacterium]